MHGCFVLFVCVCLLVRLFLNPMLVSGERPEAPGAAGEEERGPAAAEAAGGVIREPSETQ